jgi:hypothetical protein
MSLAAPDPQGVIDAAQLVARQPGGASEAHLKRTLEAVRERKSVEHGRWREAESALLGALSSVRRAQHFPGEVV